MLSYTTYTVWSEITFVQYISLLETLEMLQKCYIDVKKRFNCEILEIWQIIKHWQLQALARAVFPIGCSKCLYQYHLSFAFDRSKQLHMSTDVRVMRSPCWLVFVSQIIVNKIYKWTISVQSSRLFQFSTVHIYTYIFWLLKKMHSYLIYQSISVHNTKHFMYFRNTEHNTKHIKIKYKN